MQWKESISTYLSTYFVRVAQTKSAGSVAGSESACRILVPLWWNIQLANPLLADSIYVWNTWSTVSGISPINASWRCCWHSIHSGSKSCASGIASCTTNVDWTAKHRVQLIKLLRCKNCSASSKPCWHIFDRTSGFGGNKMRMKRFIFCRDSSILVLAQFTCFFFSKSIEMN